MGIVLKNALERDRIRSWTYAPQRTSSAVIVSPRINSSVARYNPKRLLMVEKRRERSSATSGDGGFQRELLQPRRVDAVAAARSLIRDMRLNRRSINEPHIENAGRIDILAAVLDGLSKR